MVKIVTFIPGGFKPPTASTPGVFSWYYMKRLPRVSKDLCQRLHYRTFLPLHLTSVSEIKIPKERGRSMEIMASLTCSPKRSQKMKKKFQLP